MDNLLNIVLQRQTHSELLKTQTRYYRMFFNAKRLPLLNMMWITCWNTVLQRQTNSEHSRPRQDTMGCSLMQNICHCQICQYNSLPKISVPFWRTTFLDEMQERKIRNMKKRIKFKVTTILLTYNCVQVPFQFTTQGQTVALCCDDCFYISQVLLPIRSNLAGHFYGTEGDGKHIQMARI